MAAAVVAVALPAAAWGSAAPLRCDREAPRKHCVAVPPGYDGDDRRYAVVYLLEVLSETATPPCISADCPRLAPLLALARERGLIVVMPFTAGGVGGYVDWRHDPDGSRQHARVLVERLVPAVDAAYRTIPDRAHRAIAGISAGGYGALALAARYPDLFSSVGSFSAPVDPLHPGVAPVQVLLGAQSNTSFSWWGDPVRDEVWWRGASPLELAGNLAPLSTFHSSGTGVACDVTEANPAATNPVLIYTEATVHDTNQAFDARLDELGIAHTYRERCGTHNGWAFGHWAGDFAAWLETLTFGRPMPTSFDHRRVEPRFSVFDWTVRADDARAAEFLDLQDVSRGGLTATGSGSTEFVSPPQFEPSAKICLRRGARADTIRAEPSGRLRFTLELGPPNRAQQYSAERRLRDTTGETRQTMSVALSRGRCR
jgi:diacylglycerol O-acyltransferase/trehalose O-mycolyltransferase